MGWGYRSTLSLFFSLPLEMYQAFRHLHSTKLAPPLISWKLLNPAPLKRFLSTLLITCIHVDYIACNAHIVAAPRSLLEESSSGHE